MKHWLEYRRQEVGHRTFSMARRAQDLWIRLLIVKAVDLGII